jgi:hypothetical protein
MYLALRCNWGVARSTIINSIIVITKTLINPHIKEFGLLAGDNLQGWLGCLECKGCKASLEGMFARDASLQGMLFYARCANDAAVQFTLSSQNAPW